MAVSVSGFLREVLSFKKKDLEYARSLISLKEMRNRAENMESELKRKCSGNPLEQKKAIERSFYSAMKRSSHDRAGIIAEIKKASPSKGDIRPDLDPASYAKDYTNAGAAAISVLTESHFFKGTIEDLKAVRSATNLPVLRKDFTISSYQIYEARAYGANSILLITSILTREQLKDYVILTREMGMEPLVEIHSEWEIENALFANAGIIGINNRNLETLKTDTSVAKRVVPFLTQKQIPVEASGISSPGEIQKGMESGIFNFLVGESIVRADNTKEFVQSLVNAGQDAAKNIYDSGNFETAYSKRESVEAQHQKYQIQQNPPENNLTDKKRSNDIQNRRVAVKICGLTVPDEAIACAKAGADAIGLVFYPPSPRNLSIKQAAEITAALPDDIMTTGVFVDEPFEFIMERVRECRLKAVQLHGCEPPELVKRLAEQGIFVIKSLFAAREPCLADAGKYKDADAILVEYGKGVLPGGNAEKWNWELAKSALSGISEKQKVIVAGGISPENVTEAIKLSEPWCIDVSSGVEVSPGRKDIAKVEQMINQIR
ncbi:TrpC [Desulfamplus magnetovallimortis]|uniref:Multifunctional fusion protein n=1 Tax=Desulfamplus magnetovallimortis TaxID=1246637 RepID=A0A1W1HL87_9BACT|nr:indole-3-glycerol phosphate synthase TrpC [Desulfamplus magnetovallimortis]SLM33195.1 TrpC [Desulfamplus magnetovallimortis]